MAGAPASAVYAHNKLRACNECGIASQQHLLPVETCETEVWAARFLSDPGGVGPMTVTVLMENTLRSALRTATQLEPA